MRSGCASPSPASTRPTGSPRSHRRTPGPGGRSPNQDGSGTVEAVGEGVDPVLVGERVWIWEAAYQRPYGTAAEYTVVPARQTVLLGPDPSFELGAALGIPFLTAHRCLTVAESLPDRLGPGSLTGHTVLVQGGAGAVGNAAIQLARWADATVITTVSSPDKAQLAAGRRRRPRHRLPAAGRRRRGAQDRAAGRRRDRRGERRGERRDRRAGDRACTARSAMYADDGGDEVTVPVRSQMTPNARWQFVLVYTEPRAGQGDRASRTSTPRSLDGAVRVGEDAGLPLHVFPLARDRRRAPGRAGRRRRQGAHRRHRVADSSGSRHVRGGGRRAAAGARSGRTPRWPRRRWASACRGRAG